MKTDYELEIEQRVREYGFTLMDEALPEIGKEVEAVRVVQDRGFGGVILNTKRIVVSIVRTGDYEYTDLLNETRMLSQSEFLGWREPETNSESPSTSGEGASQGAMAAE